MDFVFYSGPIEKKRVACLVAGVFEKNKLTPSAEQINQLSDGLIDKILKEERFQANPGDTLLLHRIPGCKADKVLLVGLGKKKQLDANHYLKAVTAAAKLSTPSSPSILCALLEVPVETRTPDWQARLTALIFEDSCYRFDRLKSESGKPPVTDKLFFYHPQQETEQAIDQGAREGKAMAQGMAFTKDLANLPGNICTPAYLAEQALKLGEQYSKIQVKILEKADMEKLGMGAFLAVAQGSHQPPKLITLEYRGDKAKNPPIALVGKGVTFDAGGISIKPSESMDEMKYDMCGAASVLGTFLTAAELKLPINLVGIIPATENLPDGKAIKPGDIVKTMAGKSVEILNTDAEGRLILCDALTYTQRFKPKIVVDIATLTGACVIALGKHATGLFANDDNLAQALLESGEMTLDRAWRLPLWDEYKEQLKSNFADLPNIGGREGGAITAACFLANFTQDYPWAHLDIAGTAWQSGENKGATGRPVPMLSQFLLTQLEQ